MAKWEYTRSGGPVDSLDAILAQLGGEGWELVWLEMIDHTNPEGEIERFYGAVFKREKAEE